MSDSLGALARQVVTSLKPRASAATNGSSARPPVLLTMPNNHGTLAAVRSLGRHGVRITTADPSAITIASWSKYVNRDVRCPPVRDTERFLEWLMDFGQRNERHVLLPTCDDTVWLYALHREQLSKHYYVAPQRVEVLHQLLNKRLLAEHATAAGLETPRTWFPANEAELVAIADKARFPVLLKPITQVLFLPSYKGFRVQSREELLRLYPELTNHPYGQAVRDYDESVTRPMVQEYYADASQRGIYSISGYARDGVVLSARSCRKVLQWPRRLGVGVCFEESPLRPDLVDGLGRLVRRVGFHGTFEAEFVQDGDNRRLIDFNPRFFNQMGFDVARGAPLPILAYEDALGNALDADESVPAGVLPRIYVHGNAWKVLLGSQRLSGALTPSELETWTAWFERNRDARVDAVLDADDRAPAFVDAALLLKRCARHPYYFVKDIVLNV